MKRVVYEVYVMSYSDELERMVEMKVAEFYLYILVQSFVSAYEAEYKSKCTVKEVTIL